MVNSLLVVGRQLGLENVSQLRGLVRGIKNAGSGTARIKLDSNDIDTFYKMLSDLQPDAGKQFSMTRLAFPEVFAKGVQNVIDIVAKKFGKGSGKIVFSSAVKNGENVVAKSNAKILGNKSGGRIVANSNIGEKASSAIDMLFCKYRKRDADLLMNRLINGINYTENAGVSRLTADVKNAGVIRNLKADIKAPTDFVDAVSYDTAGKSLGQIFAELKSL